MDNAKTEEVQQWIAKSQRDLKAAQLLLNTEEPLLDIAVYHCQQSAEKALKGYLVSQDMIFQKTHDLDVLLDLCAKSEPAFQSLAIITDVLTPYGSKFRYPGDAFEPERSDVVEAVEMASTVLNFVTQQLPLA